MYVTTTNPADYHAAHLQALQLFIQTNLNSLPDSKEDWDKVRHIAGFILTGITPFTVPDQSPPQDAAETRTH